jgi:DNA-binding transcriptional ArsR family regulator/DNA gyrase inhibitor GyrI
MSGGDKHLRKTLTDNTGDIAAVLSALGNERRLQILVTLLEETGGFSDLKETTGLGKTTLSHHLGILVEAGLVRREDRGSYRLHEDAHGLLTAVGDAYVGSARKRMREAKRRAELIRVAHSKGRERKLSELDVRLVDLEPMRVAGFRAISESPERDAFQLMYDWAHPRGVLNDLEKHPVFGFNNPNPSEGRKEYGYEFWVKMEDGYEEEGVMLKDVPPARYAVVTCRSLKDIGGDWMRLLEWVKANGYEIGDTQCLEKTHDPMASDEELVLDLYLPIREG